MEPNFGYLNIIMALTAPNHASQGFFFFWLIGPNKTHLTYTAIEPKYSQMVSNNIGPIGLAWWSFTTDHLDILASIVYLLNALP